MIIWFQWFLKEKEKKQRLRKQKKTDSCHAFLILSGHQYPRGCNMTERVGQNDYTDDFAVLRDLPVGLKL